MLIINMNISSLMQNVFIIILNIQYDGFHMCHGDERGRACANCDEG